MGKYRLWTQADFLKLWSGQSISLIGSAVSSLALPLTAIIALHATAGQMGLLYAAGIAPSAVIGLFAGVWADRVRRRPLMIWADLGRTVTMGAIPLLFLFHDLTMGWLFGLAAIKGGLNVIFSVAYQACLPDLVERDHLTKANSAFEGSRVFANVAGPGLAGVIIQILSAPLAVALDALSFLFSALSIGWIRQPERVTPPKAQPKMWRDMREGIAFLARDPYLRSIMIAVALFNLFAPMLNAELVFYFTTERGFSPSLIGFGIMAAGAAGVLIALVTGKLSRALGIGPAMTLAGLLICAGWGITLLAPDHSWLSFGILAVGAAIATSGDVIININGATLRQTRTPAALLGRVGAGISMTVWTLQPLGALIGAYLGATIDARAAIVVAVAGFGLAFLSIFFSPLRTTRQIPEVAPESLAANIPAVIAE